MATLYSIQAGKIANAANTYAPIGPDELDGAVRQAYFSYNFTGAEVANDIIRLTKLPPGARIIAIFMANEDCGTTVTADIGDTGDTDRLVTAYALGTAAVDWMVMRRDDTTTTENPVLGVGYKTSAETFIDITLTAVTTPTANATIRGFILYTTK